MFTMDFTLKLHFQLPAYTRNFKGEVGAVSFRNKYIYTFASFLNACMNVANLFSADRIQILVLQAQGVQLSHMV